MGILDSISKTITDAGQSIAQKGKNISDSAKLHSLISDEEKRLASIYLQIGRLYVQERGDAPDPVFSELVNAVRESESLLNDYQAKAEELKGFVRCPSCGSKVAVGSIFCAACGKRMPMDSNAPDTSFCPYCGSAIVSNSRFCTSCGKALTNNETEEKE